MRSLTQKPDQQPESEQPTKSGRTPSGQSREVSSILYLQRTIGNQAVLRLLKSGAENPQAESATTPSNRLAHDAIRVASRPHGHALAQPKLTVSTPGDAYEREADRVAARVLDGSETRDASDALGPASRGGTEIGRGGEPVSARQPTGGERTPPHSFETAVSSLNGGTPLPESERAYFEPRFGQSFESVRIHTGAAADTAARTINARAFTVGNDIAFAEGQYRTDTEDGRHLLAHELTHTVQQGQQVGTSVVQAQGGFWDTVGRGWDLYWGLSDEGTPFARQLMEHYLLGFGTDFDVSSGEYDWNEFMLGRPEIQRAMRPLLEGIASRAAGGGVTEQPFFRWGAGPTITERLTGVRLNELESMRLTLHGCHYIDVEVNYDVNAITGGYEVIFRRISMTWVDVGDMHPGTGTELNSGEVVEDSELTSAGSSFNIYIEFSPTEPTVYRVVGGAVTQESGWPPKAGSAAPAGKRG